MVLAQVGATTIMAAMAASAWQAARAGAVRLFRRCGSAEPAATEDRLNGGAALVTRAWTGNAPA
ncbi:hypothetical protein ACWEPM_11615 [Streptomyces sp. NPDC004244]